MSVARNRWQHCKPIMIFFGWNLHHTAPLPLPPPPPPPPPPGSLPQEKVHMLGSACDAQLTTVGASDEVHNPANDAVKRGLDALQMHSALTPRNIACSKDDHGGFTTIGCPRGDKQVIVGIRQLLHFDFARTLFPGELTMAQRRRDYSLTLSQ